MNLLKEAIAEFDTSDNVEVKGPMLDPILSWDGDGELPIYKDAASILERYYFNESRDDGVSSLDEADYENDKGNPASGPAMKNAKGAGTEQAGTSDAGTVKGGKDEKEKDIAKEAEDMSDKDEDEEDMNEMDMTYTGNEPKVSMPKEKKATNPEQHATGAGTEQAGTGDDEGQIPNRKDMHDQMVKPKKYTDENAQIEAALAQLEQELLEADDMDDDTDKDEEMDKELDVDKEMTKEAASAVPGGPSPKKRGEDWEDDESYYAEAFALFKEAIREEEEEDSAFKGKETPEEEKAEEEEMKKKMKK